MTTRTLQFRVKGITLGLDKKVSVVFPGADACLTPICEPRNDNSNANNVQFQTKPSWHCGVIMLGALHKQIIAGIYRYLYRQSLPMSQTCNYRHAPHSYPIPILHVDMHKNAQELERYKVRHLQAKQEPFTECFNRLRTVLSISQHNLVGFMLYTTIYIDREEQQPVAAISTCTIHCKCVEYLESPTLSEQIDNLGGHYHPTMIPKPFLYARQNSYITKISQRERLLYTRNHGS